MEQYVANKIINSALAMLKLEGITVPKGAKKYAMTALISPETFPDALTKAYNSRTKQGFCILLRIVQLMQDKPVRNFTLETLLYIHETLFCDVRTDSGILRKINMQKNGCEFLDYRHLPFSLNSILKQMDSIWSYDKPTRDDFAASLAHLFREMTILCPFPYGNGLTTNLFLEKFAVSNGFTLDFQSLSKDFLKHVDEAFRFDNVRPLYKCLLRVLSYSLTPVFVATVPLPSSVKALPSAKPTAYPALLPPPKPYESTHNARTHYTPTQSLRQEHKPFSKTSKPKRPAVKKAPYAPPKKTSRVAATTRRKK